MISLILLAFAPALLVALPVELEKPQVLAAYNENFARHTMLGLSAAAYATHPQKCISHLTSGTLKRQVTVKCDGFKGDSCSGFTAVSTKEKAIIISFRGTEGFLQIIQEGVTSIFQKKVHFVNGGNVDYYFNQAFMDVWNHGMKDDFLTLKKEHPGFELWVTGHSLGGSMASLAASYIAANGLFESAKIKLVTFGQPRTGDGVFASHHDKEIAYSFRVTHAHDLVPHVPIEAMGFTHHKAEVFYKGEDMKKGAPYHVCASSDEDKACSDGNLTDLSINDHLHYFDEDVTAFGEKGCE